MSNQRPWYDRDPTPVYDEGSTVAAPAGFNSALIYTVPADFRLVIHCATLTVEFPGGAGAADIGVAEMQRRVPAPILAIARLRGDGALGDKRTYSTHWGDVWLDEGDEVHVEADATNSAFNVTARVQFIGTAFRKLL